MAEHVGGGADKGKPDATAAMIWIFSYGTLRQPEVQIGLFGRRLEGEEDALAGHVTRLQRVTDPEVIALSGSDEHPALVETGNPRTRSRARRSR